MRRSLTECVLQPESHGGTLSPHTHTHTRGTALTVALTTRMGCNLCTLQKREEHYKLLYEIAQVNGRDFSKAGSEGGAAAVEALRREPIVVQVLRRGGGGRLRGDGQDVRVVDAFTQTDITFEHIVALAKLRPPTPPVPDICPFLLSDSCHSIHTMEPEFYVCPEYLSQPPAQAGGRVEDMEYEEVELLRLNSQEKLGLTLCYRTDDEEDTGIYVSQVGANSIAGRDGRIREGDRILQINGCDVQDREEAVALLSREDTRDILLLLTRPEIQEEEVWLDEEHRDFLEELKREILQDQRRGLRSREEAEEEEETTDTATCSSLLQEKDSGVGRLEESSEQERQVCRRPALGPRARTRKGQGQGGRRETQGREGGTGKGVGGGGVECDRFQQLLELKCQIGNGGECGLFYSRRSTIECSMTEPGGGGGGGAGVEQELRMLNEELRSIELECQSIMQAHHLRQTQRDPPSSPSISPGRSSRDGLRCHARLADIREHPGLEKGDGVRDKDSSSAYHTADSARSTPLGVETSPDHSLQRHISLTNQRNLRSTLASAPSHPRPEGSPVISSSPDQSNPSPSESDPAVPADDERCDKKGRSRGGQRPPPYASPYHTAPHPGASSHNKQLQSYMQLLQQSSSLDYSQSQVSLLSLGVCPTPLHRSPRPGEPRLEWRVKVRADGSRYVARRPARDRILRERALRIREERSGGTTTDDDAMSEMKMGRYWSKEERKQQLARAREQRRRRELLQRSLKEGPASGAEGRKEVNIVELSHKKMMKRRHRKILDSWMTIQELMSHGARSPAPEGARVHNNFLSVTTV